MSGALDFVVRLLTSEIAGRVLRAAGRAIVRQAARELTNRVSSGELNPSRRRHYRSKPTDRT